MSTATTLTPTQETRSIHALRHNMERDDWYPKYDRSTLGLTTIANVIYPDGTRGHIERVTPTRFIAHQHPDLGRFPNRDSAARVIRADALRAWAAHDGTDRRQP